MRHFSTLRKGRSTDVTASPTTRPNRGMTIPNPNRDAQLSELISVHEIMEVVLSEDTERLTYYWERGGNLDGVDENNGYTSVHWAVVNCKVDSLQWLLEHSAAPNIQDNLGWTPLHYAVHNQSLAMVQVLIDYGAIPSIRNFRKSTPAQLSKNKQITQLLKTSKSKRVKSKILGSSPNSISPNSMSPNTLSPNIDSVSTCTDSHSPSPTSTRKKRKNSNKESDKESDLQNQENENLKQILNVKEKALFILEKELRERENNVESRERFLVLREKSLNEKERNIKDKEEEIGNRELECRKVEEKHRISEISAAIPILKWKQLKFLSELGSGGFATVYRAEWRGDFVAVKVVKFKEEDSSFLKTFQQEASFLSKLRHAQIVQLMGVCLDKTKLCLVMELMINGSLADLLKQTKKRLPSQTILQIAIDTARGMNYLHTMKPSLIHRDLKPANLLLDESNRVKLSDFGLVRTKKKTYVADMNNNFAGSPGYMAPECLRQEQFDEKSDLWSYGVLLWELLTMEIPWKGKNELEIVALVGYNREKLPLSGSGGSDGIITMITHIISMCWNDESKDRPSFAKVLRMLATVSPKASD